MKYTTYESQAPRNAAYIAGAAAVAGLAELAPRPLRTALRVGAAAVAGLAAASIAARQSISSMALFGAFKLIPIKDRRDPEVFDAYMKSSSEPYVLDPKVAAAHDIKPYGPFGDTYVIDRQRDADDLVIFYIHGGGYWVRPLRIHFTMFDKIATMLHAKIVIPIYPLAPAHDAVEANDMVMERYLHLVGEGGADPQNVVFMGDSAGAGLSMSLMLRLKEQGGPLPREAVYFSPWVDATNSTPGMAEVPDPFLNLPNLTYGGEVYAGDLEGGPANPLCSPINGDLHGLPRMTAFGGTYDSLNLDAERMSDVAAAQGADYTIYVYPKMIHGYAGFFFTPEAKYAIRQVDNVLAGRPVEGIVG